MDPAFWKHFRRSRGAFIGMIVVAALALIAVLADVIAPYAPDTQFRDALLLPPAWLEGGNWRFVLGTDPVGRDILSRLIYGARFSLFIGLIVIALSLCGGVLLGLVAGFFRGSLEVVILRLMDIILAVPSLLLALVIVAILGPDLFNAMLAIAVVYLPH